MKKSLFISFLILLTLCIFIVGCDGSGPQKTSDSTPAEPSVDKNDDNVAINSLGEVYDIYEGLAPSKFYNGQSVSENFKDLDGNYMDLVFHAYLVAYKSLVPSYASYVQTLEYSNAQRHQKYDVKEWRSDVTYVEYCTYRFKNSGAVCFAEIRVFKGDFESTYKSDAKSYYAKSIRFDPTLRYDLTRKVEIGTGKPINQYDPLTGKATFFECLDSDKYLQDAFKAISPDMEVYVFSAGGKPIIRNLKGTDYVIAYAFCPKNSVYNAVAVATLYSKASNACEKSNLRSYKGEFDFDKNYYLEISCYLDENKQATRYNLRLVNNPEAFLANGEERYTYEKDFSSLEDLDEFFGLKISNLVGGWTCGDDSFEIMDNGSVTYNIQLGPGAPIALTGTISLDGRIVTLVAENEGKTVSLTAKGTVVLAENSFSLVNAEYEVKYPDGNETKKDTTMNFIKANN